jgi:hypothetical protein
MLRKWAVLLIVAAGVLSGCATIPTGPSVVVLPPPGKPPEEFQADDAICRLWAGQQVGVTPEKTVNQNTAAGAVGGTPVRASAGRVYSSEAQRRYDMTYQQCTYAEGNQIPGVAGARYVSPPLAAIAEPLPPPPAQPHWAPASITASYREQMIAGGIRVKSNICKQEHICRTMNCQARVRSCRAFLRLFCLLPTLVSWSGPTPAAAAETIFLQNGRTIHAERSEIVGDRIRIEKPTETIELPRSAVLSIHPIAPPTASPNSPLPAEVYRDLTQQMTDKIRSENQAQPTTSRTK